MKDDNNTFTTKCDSDCTDACNSDCYECQDNCCENNDECNDCCVICITGLTGATAPYIYAKSYIRKKLCNYRFTPNLHSHFSLMFRFDQEYRKNF